MMRIFGLIGYPLEHSFSPAYFRQKFENEKVTDAEYTLFPLESIHQFPDVLSSLPNLSGLNVTAPYKVSVIPFLDGLDAHASEIGSVNTILVKREGQHRTTMGFNTDWLGFDLCLRRFMPEPPTNVLILGTGGAAKAVAYALLQRKIPFQLVSRTPGDDRLSYHDLNEEMLRDVPLIVNATPLGMAPHADETPPLPFEALSERNAVMDLIYNPSETLLMQEARRRGARVCNGLSMLMGQADESWRIWNAPIIER